MNIPRGGKPNKGTKADKRLSVNPKRPASKGKQGGRKSKGK